MHATNNLTHAFCRWRDRDFLICPDGDRRLTYEDVSRLSACAAACYASAGIRAGTRVVLAAANTVETVISYFSLLKLKATPILLDPESREVNDILSRTGSTFVIAPSSNLAFGTTTARRVFFDCPQAPVADAPAEYLEFPELPSQAVIAVLFTSGSRGKPKGVKLQYRGWIDSARIFGDKCLFSNATVLLQVMPLHHGTGWFTSLIVPTLFGSSVVLLSKFNASIARSYWRYVDRYHVNYLIVIPAIVSTLLSLSDPQQRKYVGALANCSSSLLLPELKRAFKERFGIEIIEDYSTTEAGIIAISRLDQQNESVGALAGISEVRISDLGEIQVKNDHLFGGYIGDAPAEQLPDTSGYYNTGDLGRIEDGFLYLLGRKDDLIIRNGIKILPQHIDEAILRFEDRIVDASTIGVKDDSGNDRIYSFVVKRNAQAEDDEIREDLMRFLRRELPESKLPNVLAILQEIPRTGVGKPAKADLVRIAHELERRIGDVG